MDKRYRIGEVVKQLDISQHTLKHYEDKGLVTPRFDPRNGYRYYTYREIGKLLEIRMLRYFGFGVAELESFESKDAAELSVLYERKVRENAREIERIKIQNNYLERRKQALDEIVEKEGTLEMVDAQEFVFVAHFLDDALENNVALSMAESPWRDVYTKANLGIRIPLSEPRPTSIEWGLIFDEPLADNLPLKQYELAFPARKCIRTYLFISYDDEKSALDAAIESASAKTSYRWCGDGIARIASVCSHHETICFAVSLNIPIVDG